MEYITVDHTQLCYRGKPIRLRGFGIGTWMNLEHFMIGLPTSEEVIRATYGKVYGSVQEKTFFYEFQTHFFNEEDAKLLEECGINFIRVPFNYRLFIDDNDCNQYKREGFRCFDRLFEVCRKHGIFVLIDLHTTPGGQNPDWHSDNSFGVPLFWKYQLLRKQMTCLWREIARRYKAEPSLMGYDLLNEPAMGDWVGLNQFYEETITAIRKEDTNHLIVLEGLEFSMDFSGLKLVEDSKLALSFHYYPTVWHPDLLDIDLDREVRKKKIADGLDKLLQIKEQFGIPVFCGEFGYGIDCGEKDFTLALLEDTLELLEERGVDWLLWCYKDAHFMSLVSPKESGLWMKFVREIGKRWSQDIEKRQAAMVLNYIQEQEYPEITEEERYLLQFRLRACFYVLQAEHVLRPMLGQISSDTMLKMAKEFMVANCEIDYRLREVIERVTLPIQKRIDHIVEALTIQEKLQFLTVHAPNIPRLNLPAFTFGGEAAHGVEERRDQVFNLGKSIATTVFTQPIGMSATWDQELIEQAGRVTGIEARAIYNKDGEVGLVRWAPTIDMERDPRWGRTEEGYGEDPFLTGKMAGAYISGMQGRKEQYIRCAATVKHFYGNNQESGREKSSASMDVRNKKEYYLEPFRRVIMENHVEGVMTSYNEINGVPAIVNPEMNQVLRKQWGFKGHFVCDMEDLGQTRTAHHYVKSDEMALKLALQAGIDIFNDPDEFVVNTAAKALEQGVITKEEIDVAVRHSLQSRFRLGIYDTLGNCSYFKEGMEQVDCSEHRKICLEVAKKAVVLLKNEKSLLPIDPGKKESLAIIGPLAKEWHQDWYAGNPSYTVTPMEGILKEFPESEILYASGVDEIRIKVQDLYLAIDAEGNAYLDEIEKAEIFEHMDWGENRHTLRAKSNQRYVAADVTKGKITVTRNQVFSWFVEEAFAFEKDEVQESIVWKIWDQSYVSVDNKGQIVFSDMPARVELLLQEKGSNSAAKIAAKAQKVIAILGGHPIVSCKEGVDRVSIELPPVQRKLLQEIVAVNSQVILVLISNYPYALRWEQEHIGAILTTASGSQELGNGIAQVLSGRYSPAGRLNMTWYKNDAELPSIYEYDIIRSKRTYQYYEGKALYPFGYGLSYTTFAYTDLTVEWNEVALQVKLKVVNTGPVSGEEVIQLYVSQVSSRAIRPIKQLKGFLRKSLTVGEEAEIQFSLPLQELEYFDVVSGTMLVEDGLYEIQVGASSEDIRLSTNIRIPGKIPGTRDVTTTIPCDYYDTYQNIELGLGHDGFPCMMVKQKKEMGSATYRDVRFLDAPTVFMVDIKAEEEGVLTVYFGGHKLLTHNFEKMEGYEQVRIPVETKGQIVGKTEALHIELEGELRVCSFLFPID